MTNAEVISRWFLIEETSAPSITEFLGDNPRTGGMPRGLGISGPSGVSMKAKSKTAAVPTGEATVVDSAGEIETDPQTGLSLTQLLVNPDRPTPQAGQAVQDDSKAFATLLRWRYWLAGAGVLSLLLLIAAVAAFVQMGAGRMMRDAAGLRPDSERTADSGKGTAWQGWPAEAPAPAISPFDATQAKAHQAAWAQYLEVPVEYKNSLDMKFVLIPPGEFTMGGTPAEIEEALKSAGGDAHWRDCITSAGPRHKVVLTTPIYLGVHEVTQAAFEKVMGKNPSHFSAMGAGSDTVAGLDTSDHPVEMVSWAAAIEFCIKLSEYERLAPYYLRNGQTLIEGAGYRLPTEAQWELACRAGTESRYWGGAQEVDLARTDWYRGTAGERTHKVGGFEANPWGLFDMQGNVWEWMRDPWELSYYGRLQGASAFDPSGPESNTSVRVLRGGGWGDLATHCRASSRLAADLASGHYSIGLRLSLPVEAVRGAGPGHVAATPGPVNAAGLDAGWNGWPADAPPPATAPFSEEKALQHRLAWSKYVNVAPESQNSLGMKFVFIPPSEFIRGSTPAEIEQALKFSGEDQHWRQCTQSEGPQHQVVLTQPFFLSVHEVTQAQYEQVMGVNPSHFASSGSGKDVVAGVDTRAHPVEMVSWYDAAEFCEKLSKMEKLSPFYSRVGESVTLLPGIGYRLPTEAEWEFACRAGTTSLYGSGDREEQLQQLAWFNANSQDRTHEVGRRQANPFGLFDMQGNVCEWIQDGWEPASYAEFQGNLAINPAGPRTAGSHRVLRGGDWRWGPYLCRPSARFANVPTRQYNGIGFRVALLVGKRIE